MGRRGEVQRRGERECNRAVRPWTYITRKSLTRKEGSQKETKDKKGGIENKEWKHRHRTAVLAVTPTSNDSNLRDIVLYSPINN